jgi:polyisoprenoid-binding protein YceI
MLRNTSPRQFFLLPAVLVLAGVVLAADANVDAGKSTLVATFRQENVPVDAPFRKFSGSIVYDAAKPAAANASLDIDMASLDLGDAGTSAEVRKKTWFDSAAFPTASFRSTAIKPGAAGHFDATGTLTIKGRALTVTLPIAVQSAAGQSTFTGSYVLSRKSFGIGDPQWDDVLDDKVTVRFTIVTVSRK